MKKNEIKAHKKTAEKLQITNLISIIKDLEKEKIELEPYMNVEKYDTLIKIYIDAVFIAFIRQNPQIPFIVH